MAKSNADYQREHRLRRSKRLAMAEVENAELRARLAEAEAALVVATEEMERLSACQCRHPASLVDAGRCHACGSDVW